MTLSPFRHDAGAKSLIFSQWNEMLEIVARALDEAKISFLRLGQSSKSKKGSGNNNAAGGSKSTRGGGALEVRR